MERAHRTTATAIGSTPTDALQLVPDPMTTTPPTTTATMTTKTTKTKPASVSGSTTADALQLGTDAGKIRRHQDDGHRRRIHDARHAAAGAGDGMRYDGVTL